MSHLTIVDWHKRQDVRGLGAPWVKMHFAMLHDPDFGELEPAARWAYVGLSAIAGDRGNAIPERTSWLRRIAAIEPEHIDELLAAGLVERIDDEDAQVIIAETTQADAKLREQKRAAGRKGGKAKPAESTNSKQGASGLLSERKQGASGVLGAAKQGAGDRLSKLKPELEAEGRGERPIGLSPERGDGIRSHAPGGVVSAAAEEKDRARRSKAIEDAIAAAGGRI